jgi:acyl carrier protein
MDPQSKLRLQGILRAALGLPAETDLSSVGQTTTKNWESLAHIVLVMAIGTDFGISLVAEDNCA